MKNIYFNTQKMIDKAIIPLIMLLIININCCSAKHKVNGWYLVVDIPENSIEGEAIVTIKYFAEVSLDTVSFSGITVIEGRLKA